MPDGITATGYARFWLSLLAFFLIMLILASSLDAIEAARAASPTPSWMPQSNNLAEAERLNSEVTRLTDAGKYDEALPLAKRALAIREGTLGPDHTEVATSLSNLALLYDNKGDFAQAEALYQRALAIDEKALGPNHPYVATCLGNLAGLYDKMGNYAQAEPLYQRALAIDEKAFGRYHPEVAADLNNLALLYSNRGNYAKAEPLYQRALTIVEKSPGQIHPLVAITVNNLADMYRAQGDYAKAEPLYQRALVILEKTLGPTHPKVATAQNNLAEVYRAQGDYAKAEPLYQRALMIDLKVLGPYHPDVAVGLNNLAGLYLMKGDYARAEPLYQRALVIYERVLGPDHPYVASSLGSLAVLYEARDDVARAVAFRLRANNISEHNIARNLAAGSEQQKLYYLATFSDETNLTISLHVQAAPNDQAARRLALTTILRRKGRALDATAESFAALQRRLNPQDRALLDQFTNTRARLATHVLGGPGKADPAQYRAEVERLEEQAEQLEAQISARSAEFRSQSQPVTVASVQAAIPPDATLIEFVSYPSFDAKKNKWGPRRYVAYMLGNQGDLAWVALGEAAEIDRLVNDLRAVLHKDPGQPLSDIEHEVKPKARALDQRIMQPIRRLLGGKRKLLISPDGALNLIPFVALVDEQGRYLIESYSVTYLTTGRDLLRLQTRMANKQGAAIFANPDFGAYQRPGSGRILEIEDSGKKTTGGKKAEAENAAKAFDFSRAFFSALPGTAEEAQALKVIFPGAKVWTAQQATKTELKQVNAPAFLHIATHGFFLEELVISAAEGKRRSLSIGANRPGEVASPEFHAEDPLLRSGLAFAGANLHRGGDDNGILTAKEASGLNLWGTKLVVLSACDTGVGEVKNGDGVYGLRRALVLAGSETQVMSLWPVSDEGTRDLMIGYYKGLQAGGGRGEALREMQLRMLRSTNQRHPYYWASFIQSGEWGSLDEKR